MHYFFEESLRETSGLLVLSPDESRHAAKVLRLQEGDEIGVLNGKGLLAKARITARGKRGDEVICQVQDVARHCPPAVPLNLYLAPPKGKNMDWAIKCATELGVSRIIPILCDFGVAKPDGSKDAWRQTAIVACKQSRNTFLPLLDAPMRFADALASATGFSFLGAVPRDGHNTCPDTLSGPCNLWIGPEGGFSPTEEQALLDAGACPLTIGSCILRVETAVPALLGAIQYIIGK